MELVPGKEIYNGSIGAEGTLSGSFAAAEISFKIKKASPLKKITCSEAANSESFVNDPIGSKFVVTCPENCSKSTITSIYGSQVYADLSQICISAIHFSIINDKGVEVEFLIEGQQSFFKGTKSFGITSLPKDVYNRSFRFIGNKTAVYFRYDEDFNGNLKEKWSINHDLNAIKS